MSTEKPLIVSELKSTMDALIVAFEKEEFENARESMGQDELSRLVSSIEKGVYERLSHSLVTPAHRRADAIAGSVCRDSRLRFLLVHWDFVRNHVQTLVEGFEGGACCADKTRTILRTLANHLASGAPYRFDRAQQYTFHLPLSVFLEEKETVAFLEALVQLYHGRAVEYIAWMHLLSQNKPQTSTA